MTMSRSGWRHGGRADLDSACGEDVVLGLLDYVRLSSPMYALAVAARFETRAEKLCDFPGQGRRLSDYDGPREVREVFVYRWRMIYEVTPDRVIILAILHGARLIENALPL